ncbi:hypothetical protein FPV67DRAFT_854273 [Lyophyllum atratum]|nr:hypothetical protein FPV67DRAFT_854273 [Lyophyllum atratum]
MPLFSHYTTLPSSAEELIDGDDDKQERSVYSSAQPHKRLFFWACIISIVSSLISLFILATVSSTGSTLRHAPSVQPLRRPNQYMNIDKVLLNHTEPFPPIVGFPPVVLQIQRSDPKRTMHEDERGHPSPVGTIYPDDRHFVVSTEMSTVAQFRHLDYGMERCRLLVKVPMPSDILDTAIQITDRSMIDVWTLDSPDELTPYTIWEHAPARKAHFTTLTISERGEASSPEYRCPSGLFSTFEFVCSDTGKPCHVDFWQNKEKPHGGIHVVQQDSLAGNVASMGVAPLL